MGGDLVLELGGVGFEEVEHGLGGDAECGVAEGEDGVGDFGFLELELVDAFFDGVGADEFVDEDGFLLSDAVGAVGGLVFCGGVPPGVEVDDGVGGGEVEAGAAGFEGDEEDGDGGVLELGDELAAVFGFAGEFEGGDGACVEAVFDEGEHGGELGEEEDAAFFGDEGFDEVEEVEEFGGGGVAEFGELGRGLIPGDEARVAAGLAEFEEGFEEEDLGLFDAALCDGLSDVAVHGGADGFVEVFLGGGEFDAVDEDGFRGEVFGDFVFGAAEDEGLHAVAELLEA